MTIAFNLSQLANSVNSSGKLDASAGLVNATPAANGGTGVASLTANNVVLGNGTSPVNFVAPGTSGNLLVSNGTTWTSAASSTGVTSAVAGVGITVSGATGAVTISQDIYTGSTTTNADYPVGTTIIVSDNGYYANNTTSDIRTSAGFFLVGTGTPLTGTWRHRGSISFTIACVNIYVSALQRTA